MRYAASVNHDLQVSFVPRGARTVLEPDIHTSSIAQIYYIIVWLTLDCIIKFPELINCFLRKVKTLKFVFQGFKLLEVINN